ncbi:bridging integrator 3 isoform X4 [Rhineura floridana]|uniref:bridging integrator 3 isoform X4 n=1 Tax=Rhineura floridana TaxID=261503 RepID=UPI002AC835FC|nr:bridging integrator 3 isoform X4 [Rhineura floridana]
MEGRTAILLEQIKLMFQQYSQEDQQQRQRECQEEQEQRERERQEDQQQRQQECQEEREHWQRMREILGNTFGGEKETPCEEVRALPDQPLQGVQSDPGVQLQSTQTGVAKEIQKVDRQLEGLDYEELQSVAEKEEAVIVQEPARGEDSRKLEVKPQALKEDRLENEEEDASEESGVEAGEEMLLIDVSAPCEPAAKEVVQEEEKAFEKGELEAGEEQLLMDFFAPCVPAVEEKVQEEKLEACVREELPVPGEMGFRSRLGSLRNRLYPRQSREILNGSMESFSSWKIRLRSCRRT